MSLSKDRVYFCRMLARLVSDWYNKHPDYPIAIDEIKRSRDQQLIYLKKKKTKLVHSKHEDGTAADIILYYEDLESYKYFGDEKGDEKQKWINQLLTHMYKELGELWKSYDPENIWGGDWGWDANHFQYKK